MYTEESLLPEMPKDYVLRCNGKLVTVSTLDPILQETRDYLREQQNDDTRLPRTLSEENEDDSGVALIYPSYMGERPTRSETFPLVHHSKHKRHNIRTSHTNDRTKDNNSNNNDNCEAMNNSLDTLKSNPSRIKIMDYDPTRLKLKSGSSRTSRSRYDNFLSDCPTQDRNDMYRSYVTSSSGIESGGSSSSENVSLVNEDEALAL